MNQINKTELGARLAQLRKAKSYSQEELASCIGISRPSLVQIESGKRNLDVFEMQKLASTLGFSIDNLMTSNTNILEEPTVEYIVTPKKQENRIVTPIFNYDKFKNTFLYILEKTAGKPNINEQVLFSILYFCDFNYYEIYETHLSTIQFIKILNKPVPINIDNIINQLIGEESIIRIKTKATKSKNNLTRLIPLQKADLQILKASEKVIIDNLVEQITNWSIIAIESYTQKDMPLMVTKESEIINFEFAFYREAPYSVRFYNEEMN